MSACGGGGGSSDASGAISPTPTLSGKIASAAGQHWRVCLDSNKNLRCDDGELNAYADQSGQYQITLRADTSFADLPLVAELPLSALNASASGTTTVRLAAPSSSAVISSLSTLVTLQWMATPELSLDANQQKIRGQLRLPDTVDLLGTPSSSSHAGLAAIADMAMAAWQSSTEARARRAAENGSVRTLAEPADSPTQSMGQVVLAILARYIDPSDGQALPTVTTRTAIREAGEIFNPTRCAINEPLRLQIDTNGAQAIVSKDDYVKATLRIPASSAYGEAVELATSIRGRGNSTWSMPKKPYKLKLDKAASLLGMSSDKEWALLANYADKSLLRNAVAFCLSHVLGLSYTPDFRVVELELNGQYQGLYQLVEHMKTASHRIDIGNTPVTEQDPGGFALELDNGIGPDRWFRTAIGNVPFAFKSDTDDVQAPLIERLLNEFEDSLFKDNFVARGTGSYLAKLDTEAMVDFYLINEFLRNNDAFFSSTFVTRKDIGPLQFGPVWDFDISAGNINYNGNDSPEGWWVRAPTGSIYNGYIVRLFEDPSFARHVAARWAFMSRRIPALLRFITQSAQTLDAAQKRNFETWDILNTYVWPNAVVTGSYQGEVDYLKTWLQQRTTWMDKAMATGSSVELTSP